jgi:Ser/Thr protein kinase RdoA (MazF antagonist)
MADEHRSAVHAAWLQFGDPRAIVAIHDTSPMVSTNTVYRIDLDDLDEFGTRRVFAKVSNYGSYFLFAEDHDRLFRCTELMRGTRFDGFLAPVLGHDGRPFTYYDERLWVAFYREARVGDPLPPRLDTEQTECLAREMAAFHSVCSDIAPALPPTSNSIKSDAIHLLDLLSSPFAPRNFELSAEHVGLLWRRTHDFLTELESIRYDSWRRIPILVDWNLGNFSVRHANSGDFALHSRWDYDWFRVESRMLDFYFLSRVSSATGDRTHWTYSPHTLTEPSFVRFIAAYHSVSPLTEEEIRFLPTAYTFFVLNYVVREGARFFRPDLCAKFRNDAARVYLPAVDRLNLDPLLRAVSR